MLNIYFKEEDVRLPEEKIIHDVEKQFLKIKLQGDELEQKMLKEIEQATYIDKISFKDRFGFKLYTTELSTGCKAALCVINYPEKIVDLVECSLNARDAIIAFCKTGNILMVENGVTIQNLSDSIDIMLDGYRFTDIDELNEYISSIRPYEYIKE